MLYIIANYAGEKLNFGGGVVLSKGPFIRLYKSPRGYYFYDVNKDCIEELTENLYKYLDNKIPENELNSDDLEYLDNLYSQGFLSDKRVSEIKHFATDLTTDDRYMGCEQLVLQVTQACNLTCSYCPYANTTDNHLQRNHSNKMMTWEVAKKALDFYFERSKYKELIIISFYGGEPLIAFDLIKQCVSYAEDLFAGKKILFSMTSNSTLFTDEIIDFVIDHHFNLMFSIDGPEKIHDINRKRIDGSGSFKLAYNNLCKIAERYASVTDDYNISVNMVVNPLNDIDETYSFYDYDILKKYKINVSAQVIDEDLLDKEFEYNDDFSWKTEYLYFLALLDGLKLVDGLKYPGNISNHINLVKRDFEKVKNDNPGLPDVGAPAGPCVPGKRKLFVDATGSMFPCERVSELSKSTRIGDVDNGYDLTQIDKLINLAKLTEEQCKNCYAFLHCDQCEKSVDDGTSLSAAKRLSNCSSTRGSFDSDNHYKILLKESRSLYKRSV